MKEKQWKEEQKRKRREEKGRKIMKGIERTKEKERKRGQ